MSVLAQQHETWRTANNRLWRPLAAPRLTARQRMAELIERAELEAPSAPALVLSAPTGPAIPEEPSGASKMHVARWRVIAKEVCKKHDVSMADLLSPRRDTKSVRARQEAIWRCKHETTMSLPQIGVKFNRDHTTILHSVRRFAAMLSSGAVDFPHSPH